MIKNLTDTLSIDIKNEQEKFSIVHIDYWPTLNDDKDTIERHYSDRTYSYNRNKGQTMFVLTPDSVESMYNLFIYLKKCGWRQVRYMSKTHEYEYERDCIQRKYLTLESLTNQIKENGGEWTLWMLGCWKGSLAVTVEVPKFLYPNFKKDLLNFQSYKFLWSVKKTNERECINFIIK